MGTPRFLTAPPRRERPIGPYDQLPCARGEASGQFTQTEQRGHLDLSRRRRAIGGGPALNVGRYFFHTPVGVSAVSCTRSTNSTQLSGSANPVDHRRHLHYDAR